jgi:hypothetical protein
MIRTHVIQHSTIILWFWRASGFAARSAPPGRAGRGEESRHRANGVGVRGACVGAAHTAAHQLLSPPCHAPLGLSFFWPA